MVCRKWVRTLPKQKIQVLVELIYKINVYEDSTKIFKICDWCHQLKIHDKPKRTTLSDTAGKRGQLYIVLQIKNILKRQKLFYSFKSSYSTALWKTSVLEISESICSNSSLSIGKFLIFMINLIFQEKILCFSISLFKVNS